MKNRLKDVHSLNVHYYVILILKRHPELVSGSVRGQGTRKARGEMLKRVQHDIMRPNKQHIIMTTHKVILILKRHPELVSGSVRGQRQDKARCEMLKQVQHDVMRTRQTTNRHHNANRHPKHTQSHPDAETSS